MKNPKEIKLDLTIQEIDYIIKVIAKQPLENTLSLYMKLKEQTERNIRDVNRVHVDTGALAEAMEKHEKDNS